MVIVTKRKQTFLNLVCFYVFWTELLFVNFESMKKILVYVQTKCQFLTFSFGGSQRLEGFSYWDNEKSFPTKPMLKRYSQITNMENIACVDVFIKINVSMSCLKYTDMLNIAGLEVLIKINVSMSWPRNLV